MPEKRLRFLFATSDVSEQLLMRRLLRDTPYLVQAAQSGQDALRALAEHEYAAVLTDDERLGGLSGAQLLVEVEKRQPKALRLLLVREARRAGLQAAARDGRYRLFVRPFFAPQVRLALLEHAAQKLGARHTPSLAAVDAQRTIAIGSKPSPHDGETRPYTLASSGPHARRRMLLTMAELVEAKGGHAIGHAQRVSALAFALGRAVGLVDEDLAKLDEAALLHDVGELAIKNSQLHLERRWTPKEHQISRRHVEVSAQTARRAGLSQDVVRAVRHHHERWDGKGYPDGLAGGDIPLLARLIAVADTWDALAAPRPYREPMNAEECKGAIAAAASAQLDPDLVALFVSRRIYELIDWTQPSAGLLGAP